MKFLKVMFVFVMATALTACGTSNSTNDEPVKIMAPMGATALSILGLYEDENISIDTVDGSDVLSAEFNKKDGYDVIIAPINLGAKIISSGKSEYVLDRVVTWGNLYVVGTGEEAFSTEGVFAAFGEETVPQKVLMNSLDIETMQASITYFSSVNDVQAQLLSGKANVGLLAEPAATATIAKAKEKGIDLKILKDIQNEYQNKQQTQSKGYPQAALFVRKDRVNTVTPYIEKAMNFANETVLQDENAIMDAIEKATIEKLGVPSAEISQKTWARQNIKFVKANTVKDEIHTFLSQFNIKLKDTYFTK